MDDETWETLAKRYNIHEMMELVMMVGVRHMLETALNCLGVRLEVENDLSFL